MFYFYSGKIELSKFIVWEFPFLDTDYTDSYGLGLYCVIRVIRVENFLRPPEGR